MCQETMTISIIKLINYLVIITLITIYLAFKKNDRMAWWFK